MPVMPSSPIAWTQETCLRAEAEEHLRTLDKPASLLSLPERTACRALATEKRRVDWLSGRIAAKRALAARMDLPPEEIEILNEPSGRPYCTQPSAPAFSITHTAGGGLCAVADGTGLIGADWETVLPRSPEVQAFYTHGSERTPSVLASPEAQTRLWVVKEAVLKLLGLGLTCDPRDVRVLPELCLYGSAKLRWQELGSPPLSIWEKTLPDSVIAVAYTGAPHGHREE